ncbi:MAG: diguanylate cyclase [Smithellaceae bacterium]|nr:diguanylate cyclase [Smithellaceae bacterium]
MQISKISNSLSFKILAVFALIIIVISSILYFVSKKYFSDSYFRETFKQTETSVQLLRNPLTLSSTDLSTIQSRIQEIGKKVNLRITIVNRDGKVMADSEEDPSVMENHNSRTEIIDARSSGIGKSIRYSLTLKRDMLYVAMPLDDVKPLNTIIRVAIPMNGLNSILYENYQIVGIAFVVISLLAILVGIWIIRRIVKPINEMAAIAQSIAEGDFSREIAIRSNDEVGKLAAAINQMNHELKGRFTELHILRRMSELLQASFTDEEAHKVITLFLSQLFPKDSGAIYIMTPSRNLLEIQTEWGAKPPQEKFFEPHDCWALRRGQPYLAADDPLVMKCQHNNDLQGISLCIPMMAQNEELGMIQMIFGSADDNHSRLEDKKQLAITIAAQIGLALANLKLRKTLQQLSIRDPLTSLFNRRYMEETLEREILRAVRNKSALGIIMIDIDHFKRYNDTYGHEMGDKILCNLASFLQQNVRSSDVVCRFGGEEFTVILPDADLEATRNRAEFVKKMFRESQQQQSRQPMGIVEISLGVAVYPTHGSTIKEILKAADTALYRAKETGRNRICTYGEEEQKDDK